MNSIIEEKLKNGEKIIIKLGLGEKKSHPQAIGVDIIKKSSAYIVCDLNKGLSFISDNVVDKIIAHHVIEHVENLENLMKEIFRILKIQGIFEGTVPHFSNPYVYSDYTHNKFFGLYTFNYFSKKHFFKREVPLYYNDINFKIKDIKLIFRSPFRGRNLFKRFLTFLVNKNKYFQEFYEENLIYIFPCYEIYFELEK